MMIGRNVETAVSATIGTGQVLMTPSRKSMCPVKWWKLGAGPLLERVIV